MRSIVLLSLLIPLVASEQTWSLLRSLPISGNMRFSEQELRDALAGDGAVLLALQQPGERPVLLHAVAAALERGYRAHGHAEVAVTVSGDALQIDEGPHLRCGELVIDGGDEELTTWMQLVLAKPYRESDRMPAEPGDRGLEDAVWQPGEDVPFHDGGLEQIRQRLRWGLNARGYLNASSDVVLQARDAFADAHIRIEPGDPVRLRQIVLTGLEQDSRETVLELVALDEGEVLSHVAVQQAADRLRACGSFLEVTVELPDAHPGELHIRLAEHPKLPRLGEQTRRDELLLAAREAVLRLGDGLGGMLLAGDFGETSWTVQLVPAQGLDLRVAGAQPFRLALSGDRWFCQYGDALHSGPWGLRAFMQMGLTSDADSDKPRNLSFSAGWGTGEVRRPVDLDLRLDAAALLYDADEEWQLHEDNGQEILSSEYLRLAFTGGRFRRAQLLQPVALSLELQDEAELLPVPEAEAGSDLDLLAGVGRVVLQALPSQDWTSEQRAAVALLADLSAGVLRLAQAVQAHEPSVEAERFAIPVRLSQTAAADMMQLIRTLLPPAHRIAADFLGIEHWSATVIRDAHALLSGQTAGLRDDLRRLYNDDACGPIGTAVLARLLPVIDANVAELFAERLQRVSNANAFRAEWLPLTSVHPEFWLKTGRLLLEQEDVPVLAALLSDTLQREIIAERLVGMREQYLTSGQLPMAGWWALAWELIGRPLTTTIRPDPIIP
ncbi:MAG: hypothetical protein ACOCXA_02645 [Planctomycetota bacterium]